MDKNIAAEIAVELLRARELAAPVSRPSTAYSISLEDGYEIAAEMIRRRISAGDEVRGAKLGFTSPSVWPSVGLTGPLWAPVFESTYTESTEVVLHDLRAPEVEPEVVFGFRPGAIGKTGGDTASMIVWWALGLEVIDTGYPAGPPIVADQAADMCAHQKLIVGPKSRFESKHVPLLSQFESTLSRNNEVISVGAGSSVMGSPLNAADWFVNNLLGKIPWPTSGVGVLTTGRLSAPPSIPVGTSIWRLASTLPLEPLNVSIIRGARQ